MTITESDLAEWASHRGEGMQSSVGEYTPEAFWLLLDEVTRLKRREQELLEANNRYLERARSAEAHITELGKGAIAHITTQGLKHLADGHPTLVFSPKVTHEYMRPLFLSPAGEGSIPTANGAAE